MIILLTAAIAPSLALFSYFYLRDQFSQEPSKLLFQSFVYGAVLTFPILFSQYVFKEEQVFSSMLTTNILFPSLIEEFFKWLVLLIAIFRHVDFEDPYDGILYGASVSLGFATVENILYLFEYGTDIAFMRALLPVSSHALFGVVMGYYFGKAKFSHEGVEHKWLFLALFIPFALHFLYNSSLNLNDNLLAGAAPFMLFLWWFGLKKVKQAHLLSLSHYHQRNSRTP